MDRPRRRRRRDPRRPHARPDTDRDDIAAVQAWIARDVTPALDELADLL
ncbi:MAG: hypothetical protein OXF61_00300 [Acidimicrobiaceae bacterium]|nr:hypothetical protein [Acidimicrobiaceae bacterium]